MLSNSLRQFQRQRSSLRESHYLAHFAASHHVEHSASELKGGDGLTQHLTLHADLTGASSYIMLLHHGKERVILWCRTSLQKSSHHIRIFNDEAKRRMSANTGRNAEDNIPSTTAKLSQSSITDKKHSTHRKYLLCCSSSLSKLFSTDAQLPTMYPYHETPTICTAIEYTCSCAMDPTLRASRVTVAAFIASYALLNENSGGIETRSTPQSLYAVVLSHVPFNSTVQG